MMNYLKLVFRHYSAKMSANKQTFVTLIIEYPCCGNFRTVSLTNFENNSYAGRGKKKHFELDDQLAKTENK